VGVIAKTRKIMEEFLQDCENKSLIKFPNPEVNDLMIYADKRIVSELMASSAQTAIDNYYRNLSNEEKKKFIPENEWKHYVISNFICSVKNNSEELKTFLKAIINPQEISPDITEIGKYLSQIYDKLGYDKEKRKQMNEDLFVNMRNAFNHNDYVPDLNGIIYCMQDRNQKIPIEDLPVILLSMNELTEVINDKVTKLKSKK